MKNELQIFRKEVDKIDNKIINLLEKRFEIVRKIRKHKLKNYLSIKDKKREKEIINSKIRNSALSKNFIKKLFNLVLTESKKIQRKIK